jgi:transposase
MQIICGVDVSKAWLDAWIEPAGYRRVANTPEGVEQLSAWCREYGAGLVVMEASGGVEQAAFLALWKQGQPCAIATPEPFAALRMPWAILRRPIGSTPR